MSKNKTSGTKNNSSATNKSANRKEGWKKAAVAGYSLAGDTRNLIAGKDVLRSAIRAGKNARKLVEGVKQGIFNDPRWYAYQGVIPEVAASIRPFTPEALARINGEYGPGLGIHHVIKYNWRVNSIAEATGFSLAMSSMYKRIREELRSNLPYTQSELTEFITRVTDLIPKVKFFENLLSAYSVTRADIPELHDALFSYASGELTEMGVLYPAEFAPFADDYANVVNKFHLLSGYTNLLAFPRTVTEYYDWFFRSYFSDNQAVNPEVFVNIPRIVPQYFISEEGDTTSINYVDISSVTIDSLIDEAKYILNKYGVINADIQKRFEGTFSSLTVGDGADMRVLHDDEMFSIFTNAVSVSAVRDPHFKAQYLNNGAYVRMDVVSDKMTDANMLGVMSAFGSLVPGTLPVEYLSTEVYYASDAEIRWYRDSNVFVAVPAYADHKSKRSRTVSTNGLFVRFSNLMNRDSVVTIMPGGTMQTIYATPSNKLEDANYPSISNIQINVSTDRFVRAGSRMKQNLIATFGNNSAYIEVTSDGQAAIALYYNDALVESAPITGVTVKPGSLEQANGPTRFGFNVSGSGSISPSNAGFIMFFKTGSTIYDVLKDCSFTIEETETSITATSYMNQLAIAAAISCEFYPPIVIGGNQVIKDIANTATVTIDNGTQLLKQVFRPYILDTSNLEATIQWMVAGLFDMG